jgi:hypothetical protein
MTQCTEKSYGSASLVLSLVVAIFYIPINSVLICYSTRLSSATDSTVN